MSYYNDPNPNPNTNQTKYDYIIVGAGPCGLTLATYLSKYHKKCLIIDREETIGGCHRVRRVNGLFTEHGPRIYTGSSYAFQNLLKTELKTSFNDIFVKSKYMNYINNKYVKNMSLQEILAFIKEYFFFLLGFRSKKTMKEFTQSFSPQTIEFIDHVCKTTDGAGIDRYTLTQFLQIINQHALYNIYQPRLPNDLGLFPIWEKILLQRGVDIVLNTKVETILKTGNEIIVNGTYTATNIIFAIPPENLSQIFPEINSFAQHTKYLTYLPFTFHWNQVFPSQRPKIKLSEWGIIDIHLSNSTKFSHPDSKTVISVCIMNLDTPSKRTGKTANQSSLEEISQEILKHLLNFPPPTHIIPSPEIYRENERWVTRDRAFMTTPYGFINSKIENNIYTCGFHTGKSKYHFTSIEGAVQNAIYLVNDLLNKDIKISQSISLNIIIKFLILIIVFYKILKQ